ncbi:hypothetical protein [Nonomuraea roseola]|uniref:Uncharacterized protein n=1 Tax=Nonomuraea roseola TaxID=46179 RepID=A0ABV5Q220_9ACTN
MKARVTTQRTIRFTIGWTITATNEATITKLPASAWQAALPKTATCTASKLAHAA